MNKIAVIGSGGAGKSTLSRRMSEVLDIPVYHLDAYYWKPDWIPTETEEWIQVQSELMKKEQWIIDGNYGRTMDLRLAEADTILFVDLSPWITTYRVIKRRVMYHGKARPDMNQGCPERLDWTFVKWVWHYRRDKRDGIMNKLEALKADKQIIVLRSRAEVSHFLKQLEKDCQHMVS